MDAVFDEYIETSIENIERAWRSQGILNFQQIIPSAEIKRWRLFLSSSKNKNSLIQFIISQWTQNECMKAIDSKEFYVTFGQVMKIENGLCSEVESLLSNHEEADTRMILNTKHVSLFYRVLEFKS